MTQVPTRKSIIAGEVFASREPAEIKTVLGSCVAACLFDPETRIGGMNHFMLPDTGESRSARFGAHAMELLINQIMQLGGRRELLQAKVFGGADVLSFSMSGLSIGSRNAAFVLEFLDCEGIPVVSKRLGGNVGLRVHFYTHSSRALIKPVGGASRMRIRAMEENYKQTFERTAEAESSGEVTLF